MSIYQQRFLSPRERFEQKCEPVPWSGCWIWMERTDARSGKMEYGQFWYMGKNTPAHRASWLLYRGPILDGMCVCHNCDIPYCVNPEHLFLGSNADNTRDMIAKGRNLPMVETRRGERSNFNKLTVEQVDEIRRATGKQRDIAARFNISQPCVSLIKRRINWRHA